MASYGKKIKIGINGFGKIGELVARAALLSNDVELLAINDPSISPEFLKYMFIHDVHHEIKVKDSKTFLFDQKPIAILGISNPEEIPWGEVGVDYVVESTCVLTDKDKAAAHLKGGAKKVIISAPSQDAPMFVVGVNEHDYKSEFDIVSSASCTTNCLGPFVKIIHEKFGIVKAQITTINSVIDNPKGHDGLRRSWFNPCSTEGVEAIGQVIPSLNGVFTVKAYEETKITLGASTILLVAHLEKNPSIEEVKDIIKEKSEGELKGIISYADGPLSSNDILGDNRSGIFYYRASSARNHVFKNFLNFAVMYDSEWGYSNRVVDLIRHIASKC